MQTIEPCRVCCGSGQLEYYEEAGFNEDWRRRKADETPPALLDKMAESIPWMVRVVEDDCEICHGAGEYVIEHFTCKIF